MLGSAGQLGLGSPGGLACGRKLLLSTFVTFVSSMSNGINDLYFHSLDQFKILTFKRQVLYSNFMYFEVERQVNVIQLSVFTLRAPTRIMQQRMGKPRR